MPASSANPAIRTAASRWRRRIRLTVTPIPRRGEILRRVLREAGGRHGSPGSLVTRRGGSRRRRSGIRQLGSSRSPVRLALMCLSVKTTVPTEIRRNQPRRGCLALKFLSLMGHRERNRRVVHQMIGYPAENHLTQARMAVSAQHDDIAFRFLSLCN